MTAIRVLLVDDHPVVRAGLRAMLTELEGITVAAEAADGAAALAALSRLQALGEPADVVLMDLQMGAGMDGVTATGRIQAGDGGTPAPPVLILTTFDSDADILAAVEAGASGYMLKDAPPEQIRQAVLAAAAGQTALAPEVAARLLGRMRSPGPALSAREIQLLGLLAAGLGNRAIAKQLYISEATVKTHLVHIYDKLGVQNRTAAVAAAVQQRIIRPHGSADQKP
ncbi:response regulator transcription factor [Arthrobacter sp. Soil763]|uniref:response regulator transcription factor n=1 Tax=Arthrobacter sp. Soil763 TaxID=1736402 RepID=UPI0006F2C55A|nr:response regulator transcription factor [Arthrobacter sp. Soil763]KRE81972.1 LuxR family transcriptional regulator [Arthrobacter sp. Soil763]